MNEYGPMILVIDDTVTNIDILTGILSDDFDVAVAMNGNTALSIIRDDAPDLILLDIMMPEMDGFEVCQRLKENPSTASIPVIFLSALTDEEYQQKALELGAVDFISKPFNREDIITKIKAFL